MTESVAGLDRALRTLGRVGIAAARGGEKIMNPVAVHAHALNVGGGAWPATERCESKTRRLSAQVQRGFMALWFAPALEREFAQYLRESSHLSRATLCAIALMTMIATTLLDTRWMGLPATLADPSRWLQFGLMVPLGVAAIVFCLARPASRSLEWILVLMFFGMVAGVLVQRTIDTAYGYDLPLELAGVIIAAMFALGRVRFWIMLPSALLAYAAIVANELLFVAPEPVARYHLFATTVLTLVGICTGYSSEYFIRWTWLNSTLLRYLCHMDGLTGLLNRPALENAVCRAQADARRESRGYAIAMIDIDGFGDYNDYYGHQLGDRALRQVADVLGAAARRPQDVCGRYGGEEFLLLWTDGGPSTLFALAEAARAAVENVHIAHAKSPAAPWITVSIGICHVDAPTTDLSFEQVIARADHLLYQAKAAGRNCVRCGCC